MRRLYALVFVVVGLLIVSCTGSGSEYDKALDGKTVIEVEFDTIFEGSLVVDRMVGQRNTPLDTVLIDEKGKAKFVLDLQNVSFLFVSQVDRPGGAFLVAHPGDKLKINCSKGNLSFASKVSGTPEALRLDEFIAFSNDFRFYMDSLKMVYKQAKAKNQHYAIEKQIYGLNVAALKRMENYAVNYIKSNPNQISNLIVAQSLDLQRFKDLHLFVDSVLFVNYPNLDYVVNNHSLMAKRLPVRDGKAVPDFVLPDSTGKKVMFSTFKGKYVLLDFWATWCGPCIREFPHIKKAYDKFGGKDFEVVSVCVDQPSKKQSWKKLIVNKKANWVHLFDGTGRVSEQYQIKFFPTTFLVDPNGKVIAKNVRGEQIYKKLETLIPVQ